MKAPSIPEQKIRMIKRSWLCYVYGMLGIIPIIGIGFSVAALWYAGSIRTEEKQLWNPAKAFRSWGTVMAGIFLVLWSGILIIAVVHAANLL